MGDLQIHVNSYNWKAYFQAVFGQPSERSLNQLDSACSGQGIVFTTNADFKSLEGK